jgi:hypothetical protein
MRAGEGGVAAVWGPIYPATKPGQERVDSRKVATVLAAQYDHAFAVPDFAPLSALCDLVEARGDAVDGNGNWVIPSPTRIELARASWRRGATREVPSSSSSPS